MKSRSLAISLAILVLAALAPGASAQQPKPGGQIVHGSAQEPDRIWGPVTGLTVSGEISQLVNASLIEINDKLEYAPSLAIASPIGAMLGGILERRRGRARRAAAPV